MTQLYKQLSCPAEKFEELVEKAVLTEYRLNSTNKSNVNWMEEVDRHGYGALARKFSNSDRCDGAKDPRQTFINTKAQTLEEKVTLCSYCGSPDQLWDVCEERRNTPWCEKCGQLGHDISMCRTFVNTHLTGNTRQQCLKQHVPETVRYQDVVVPEGMALVKIIGVGTEVSKRINAT